MTRTKNTNSMWCESDLNIKDWRNLLSPSELQSVEDHKEVWESKYPTKPAHECLEAAWVLGHDARKRPHMTSFAGQVPKLPCFVKTHLRFWLPAQQRWITADEKLGCQGLPMSKASSFISHWSRTLHVFCFGVGWGGVCWYDSASYLALHSPFVLLALIGGSVVGFLLYFVCSSPSPLNWIVCVILLFVSMLHLAVCFDWRLKQTSPAFPSTSTQSRTRSGTRGPATACCCRP